MPEYLANLAIWLFEYSAECNEHTQVGYPYETQKQAVEFWITYLVL